MIPKTCSIILNIGYSEEFFTSTLLAGGMSIHIMLGNNRNMFIEQKLHNNPVFPILAYHKSIKK